MPTPDQIAQKLTKRNQSTDGRSFKPAAKIKSRLKPTPIKRKRRLKKLPPSKRRTVGAKAKAAIRKANRGSKAGVTGDIMARGANTLIDMLFNEK